MFAAAVAMKMGQLLVEAPLGRDDLHYSPEPAKGAGARPEGGRVFCLTATFPFLYHDRSNSSRLPMLPIPKRHLVFLCMAVLVTAATARSQSPRAENASPAASVAAVLAPSPAVPPAPSAAASPKPSAAVSPTASVAASPKLSAAASPSVTPSPKPALKSLVTLVGANENNDAVSIPVPLGAPLSLILVIKEPPAGHPRGELRILPFATQGEQPPTIATARIRTGESNGVTAADAGDSAPVTLDKPGQFAFSLNFDRLRPGKTYKGQLFLTSSDLLHHWDVSLTTGGRGVIAVDPVGTLKFVRSPCSDPHSFSFTLYDKSEGGPYHHVRARFEPSASANSKGLTSNFLLSTLSFWDNDNNRIDLERQKINDAENNAADVILTEARTFTAQVGSLSPGEYSGALHFAADEASDDAAEAKLPLTIQVRDHWVFPVLVIVIGSIFGWFTSKYVVGTRRARDLSRQIKELRDRAESLGRPIIRTGWTFPSEDGSLGFARLGVSLNRLARLTASTMEVIFHGDEIEQLRQRAELRLSGLESLRKTRLLVQPAADERPAAQLTIGRLLRSAVDLLDRPTFTEVEQAELRKLLDAAEAWANPATSVGAYQQALLARRRSRECPSPGKVSGLKSQVVREQLVKLLALLPDEKAISAQTTLHELKESDEAIARIALLWRESTEGWADDVAGEYAAGNALDYLFRAVDKKFWDAALKPAADAGQIVPKMNEVGSEKLQTFKVVEMDLVSESNVGVARMRRHPLRIAWRITPPGGDARKTQTDGLTLVQYFPEAGSVKVEAALHWLGERIELKPPLSFTVAQNPEYGRWRFTKGWIEYAAIAIATLFAIVTAMGAQYDSTFGTLAQYFTMFIWAAGAGTGGNLFSQLGATSAPGGAASTIKVP